MAEMAIAGTVREYHPKGFWWTSINEEDWPKDEESLAYIKENWHPHFGDRSQKLVFIGKNNILGKIKESLEESLLTDEELTKSADFIKQLKDPFGDWNQVVQTNESESAGPSDSAEIQ